MCVWCGSGVCGMVCAIKSWGVEPGNEASVVWCGVVWCKPRYYMD